MYTHKLVFQFHLKTHKMQLCIGILEYTRTRTVVIYLQNLVQLIANLISRVNNKQFPVSIICENN